MQNLKSDLEDYIKQLKDKETECDKWNTEEMIGMSFVYFEVAQELSKLVNKYKTAEELQVEENQANIISEEEFKERVTNKLQQLDETISEDDLYLTKITTGLYCLSYEPDHPDYSEYNFLVHYDLTGSVSVHGNKNAIIPFYAYYKDIEDFENNCLLQDRVSVQVNNVGYSPLNREPSIDYLHDYLD